MLGHLIGCHARCFRGRQWLPQLRRYVLRSIVHFIYLKRLFSITLQYLIALVISTVNLDFAKSYETLSGWLSVSLKPRVDYLNRLVSLITVNTAANKFFRFAVAIVFLLTSKHTSSTVATIVVHGNNVRDSRLRDLECFPFIARYFDFIAR